MSNTDYKTKELKERFVDKTFLSTHCSVLASCFIQTYSGRRARKKENNTSNWTNLIFLLQLSIYESNALTEEGKVARSQSRGGITESF